MNRPPRPQPTPSPARIWGFVASEAPKIALLRRGPSKWTQMWLWNTETDELEAGSWFAGHIYYSGCDLSPDGRHFIYYAANDSDTKLESARQKFGIDDLYDWTTVCQPPYFRSCGSWTQSPFAGGGHFRDGNQLALDKSAVEFFTHSTDLSVTGDAFNIPFEVGLHRTGWQGLPLLNWKEGYLRKGVLSFDWRDDSGFSVSRVATYHYTHPNANLKGVSWADLDQRGRLVYARAGCLYRHTEAGERLIADLNASQPQRPWLQPKEKTAPKGG